MKEFGGSGRLQNVVPEWAPPPAQLQAVYGSPPVLSVTGRAFIGELEEFCGRCVGWMRCATRASDACARLALPRTRVGFVPKAAGRTL